MTFNQCDIFALIARFLYKFWVCYKISTLYFLFTRPLARESNVAWYLTSDRLTDRQDAVHNAASHSGCRLTRMIRGTGNTYSQVLMIQLSAADCRRKTAAQRKKHREQRLTSNIRLL